MSNLAETLIAVIAVVLPLCVTVVIVVWRLTACVLSLGGVASRVSDKERKDHQQQVSQLVEKALSRSDQATQMAGLHAQERLASRRIDTDADVTLDEILKKSNTKNNGSAIDPIFSTAEVPGQ